MVEGVKEFARRVLKESTVFGARIEEARMDSGGGEVVELESVVVDAGTGDVIREGNSQDVGLVVLDEGQSPDTLVEGR